MLIQGSVLEDLYIPDTVLEGVERSLLLLPEVASIEIDPEIGDIDGDLVLTVWVSPKLSDEEFNGLYEKIRQIEEDANKNLGTKIYLLLDKPQSEVENAQE